MTLYCTHSKDILHVPMMNRMQKKHLLLLVLTCCALLLVLAACGPSTTDPSSAQATVTVNPSFQSQVSPIPTVAPYLCGAWSSNNAPGPYSTIQVYARLMHNMQGVAGATATGVVHFQTGDVQFDQSQVSDSGGYVVFTLPLQGREAKGVPATVDITFTNFPGGTLHCTSAFFTPQ